MERKEQNAIAKQNKKWKGKKMHSPNERKTSRRLKNQVCKSVKNE